ncbi:cytokine receptor family member B16 isoform X2 [Lates calcarifer]|uniref:Cytokine receptor family member B16 isoform X2 n=1 Tax=Lates calcarifer TaxID=8187 RepID=A0AAJ7LU43_LATCA|nr:cytokine receptor family member B16 isoform X2 [Lates calcarifer]
MLRHGGPDVSRPVSPFALELKAVVMRRRWAVSLLWMMMLVLLDLNNGVWMLPAPSRVSMESVDMRHTLTWLPLQASCNTTILYSVQFQGEFELTVLNGSWVDAPECHRTPHTHCDLTFDLGSDSDYNLHVRAQCGSQLSAWTRLSRPFNRRDTVLTVPDMTLSAVGNALQVSFDKLPLTAVVRVTVWKRGDELQASVHTLPAEQKVLHVAALQEGAVYCVRAQTVLDTQLQSSSTDAHCVSITGPDAAWKRPTTVTVTVIIMAGLLFAVFWSIIHCRPDTCQKYFHKETLPQSLRPVGDIQVLMRRQEEERCEQIDVTSHVDDHSSRRPFTEDSVE